MQKENSQRNLSLESTFIVGNEYENMDNFISELMKFHLNMGYSYKIKYRNKVTIKVICKETNCNIFIRARTNIMGFCTIKAGNFNHTCTSFIPKITGICKSILPTFGPIEFTPKQLCERTKVDFGVNISYKMAWSALNSNSIKTGTKILNSYECLEDLANKMINNGDICEIQKSKNNNFKRIFISFNASKIFFNFSRKFICVDGTFLLGPNKGTLLIATCQDSENHTIIIAFAIVESENNSSWVWFFSYLNRYFNLNSKCVVVMSDRDKGILNAVNTCLPNATKANCAFHLSKNILLKFKSQ